MTAFLLFAAGAVLVVVVLADIFRSVVLPRPATRVLRLSALISRIAWTVITRVRARFAFTGTSLLAVYASFMLVVFLITWVVALIFGYALMFFALRSEVAPHLNTFGEALYFAGTTFLTIGFGDFHPVSAAPRILSVMAGMSGFAVIAVVATFLFSILGGFQQREIYVATLSQRIDATPGGLTLLLSIDPFHRYDDLTTLFRDARRWIAAVSESHLAYPVLTYFRSTREGDSWVSTLAAVMDAAALVLCYVECESSAEAVRTLMAGQRLVDAFVHYFELRSHSDGDYRVAPAELIGSALRDAGYSVRTEMPVQRRFEELQGPYRDKLDAMTRFWLLPAIAWTDEATVRAAVDTARSIAEKYELAAPANVASTLRHDVR